MPQGAMNPTLSREFALLLAFGAHHLLGVLRVLLIRLEEFPERIAQMDGMVS